MTPLDPPHDPLIQFTRIADAIRACHELRRLFGDRVIELGALEQLEDELTSRLLNCIDTQFSLH
jgi:hypothetical protein